MTENIELEIINNKLSTFTSTIDNAIENTIDNAIDNAIDNTPEDDNKSETSNISNLSSKLIIDNISSSIRDEFTQNKPTISIVNYLNNTLSSWDSNINISNLSNILNSDSNKIIELGLDNINNVEIPNANPNVTFSSYDINEIKSYTELHNNINNSNINSGNKYNNSDNLSSINSGSEISYTAIANKQLPLDNSKKPKHIRGTKKKNKSKDDNELDDIDYLYNKIQDYMRYMTINRFNYILLIVKAMEIIENSNNANDIDKKTTVTKALNRIVLIDLNLSDFDQGLFLASLNNIIEIIIICSKVNSNNSKYSSKINNDKNNNEDLILASSGQIIHSLIDKITTIVIKKQYNADKLFVNICTITDILMILVNKYNYINSIEKKIIVIQAFTIFINEKLEYIIDLTKEKKKNLILALDSIPFIIDLFISLQNGKYKINRKMINMVNKQSCFRRLFCGSKHNDD